MRYHHAIRNNDRNINVLIEEYQTKFLRTLIGYKLDHKEMNNDNFIQIVEHSIDKMMDLKDDFIHFVEIVINTDCCNNNFFTDFCEKILQTYEDNNIDINMSDDIIGISYDNYRYFNLDLFLSLSAILIENNKFNILNDLLKSPFLVESDRYRQTRTYNFTQFNQYNYTIEKYKKNRSESKPYTEIGIKIEENAKAIKFRKIIKADIMLYYLSLLYSCKNYEWNYWIPYTSVFNNQVEILPKLISKRYFEKAKVLFSVNTIEEYKQKISQIKQPQNLGYMFQIPMITAGLMTDKVGSIE